MSNNDVFGFKINKNKVRLPRIISFNEKLSEQIDDLSPGSSERYIKTFTGTSFAGEIDVSKWTVVANCTTRDMSAYPNLTVNCLLRQHSSMSMLLFCHITNNDSVNYDTEDCDIRLNITLIEHV